MAGTEYFGATAQPHDHIPEFGLSTLCGNHTITHFRGTDTTIQNQFLMWNDDVNRAAKLPVYWPVNWEDLGTSLSCFGSEYTMAEHIIRFTKKNRRTVLAKNITKTTRRQLDGPHLLFGEYLQNWTTLFLRNLPIIIHYRRWTQQRWR